MFERLQKEVDKYNEECVGGKAVLQWYEASNIDGGACEDSETESIPETKRKKRNMSDKPLILVILSPLMARAHSEVQQSGELVFLRLNGISGQIQHLRFYFVHCQQCIRYIYL